MGVILAEEHVPGGFPKLIHADLAVGVGVQALERRADDVLSEAAEHR